MDIIVGGERCLWRSHASQGSEQDARPSASDVSEEASDDGKDWHSQTSTKWAVDVGDLDEWRRAQTERAAVRWIRCIVIFQVACRGEESALVIRQLQLGLEGHGCPKSPWRCMLKLNAGTDFKVRIPCFYILTLTLSTVKCPPV